MSYVCVYTVWEISSERFNILFSLYISNEDILVNISIMMSNNIVLTQEIHICKEIKTLKSINKVMCNKVE